TEWSEPSPVVGLPRTWEVLAGEMKKTKTVDIRVSSEVDASFEMPGEEPTIRTMAITWNPKFAADVPGEAEVSRGSVLNFTTNVNVLHPPTTSVVTLPDY